jgi:hypothetical protein
MSTLKMIYRPFFTILLVMGLFSCEFRIKETEYDNGPGKAQEDPNSEMSNPDVSKDFLLGKFDYRKDEKFVLVDKKWSKKEVYLQKKAFVAFVKMAEAAKEDGVDLFILSGTRSFSDQKRCGRIIGKKIRKRLKTLRTTRKKYYSTIQCQALQGIIGEPI